MNEYSLMLHTEGIAGLLMEACKKRRDELEPIERDVLAAYLFGALNAYLQSKDIDDGDVEHMLLLTSLQRMIGYSKADAYDIIDYLTLCIDEEFDPAFKALIDKGVAAYAYLNDMEELSRVLRNDMEIVKNAIEDKE